MGGSQALARSLFSQISPETRSGEFFSFFGFMSRASSVLGPIIYVLVTGMLDTRSAVFAISSSGIKLNNSNQRHHIAHHHMSHKL